MISSAIYRFQKTYAIKRILTEGFDSNGYAVKTYAASATFEAVIQPLRPDELRNMPEGQNNLDWLKIYSLTSVALKDLITYRGFDYEIQKIAIFEDLGPHYRAYAVKVKD